MLQRFLQSTAMAGSDSEMSSVSVIDRGNMQVIPVPNDENDEDRQVGVRSDTPSSSQSSDSQPSNVIFRATMSDLIEEAQRK